MLKSRFTSLALGATIAVATLATDITPVPVALAQTPSSQGPAFDAGLADRRAYEEWFASLTGDFKKGAAYWTVQRSLPEPGSCHFANGLSVGEWTDGCIAAQRQFAVSDVRKKTEPDYRRGWYSYDGGASQSTAPAIASTPMPVPNTGEVGTASVPTATPSSAELSRAYAEGLAWSEIPVILNTPVRRMQHSIAHPSGGADEIPSRSMDDTVQSRVCSSA
jgi:hypothetical protein